MVANEDGAKEGVIIDCVEEDGVPTIEATFGVVCVAEAAAAAAAAAAADAGPRNTPPTPPLPSAAAAAAALAQAAAAAATAVDADDQVVVNCRHIVCHIEGK